MQLIIQSWTNTFNTRPTMISTRKQKNKMKGFYKMDLVNQFHFAFIKNIQLMAKSIQTPKLLKFVQN